ncbi:hypothetical protein [Piscinibacter defluvii]|uniref:hypothetical protein n=1 Tax=Piscinibacter defluvii TaxID=1796922 RepID=UPI000FDCFB18|nr:hypothetical protein [Piscinibacter defluvii]
MLAATVVLSAIALWVPEEPPAGPGYAPSELAAMAPRSPAGEPGRADMLPAKLPAQRLEPARFDPFVGVAPPPPEPPPAPRPVAAAPPAPPPAPEAPVLAYRYLGRMTDPTGQQHVYLAKADAVVVVTVGMRLEEGYMVEAIGPSEIRLHYPPLGAHAAIPVPPEAEPSSR